MIFIVQVHVHRCLSRLWLLQLTLLFFRLRRRSAPQRCLYAEGQPVHGVARRQEGAEHQENDEQRSQEALDVMAVEHHRQSDGDNHR